MNAKYKTNPKEFNVLLYVDDFEVKTREIMSEVWARADEDPRTADVQRGLARAFVAAHSISGPASRWIQLANALSWVTYDDAVVQRVLTRMKRKGYIRSRQQFGKTLYEVNY